MLSMMIAFFSKRKPTATSITHYNDVKKLVEEMHNRRCELHMYF